MSSCQHQQLPMFHIFIPLQTQGVPFQCICLHNGCFKSRCHPLGQKILATQTVLIRIPSETNGWDETSWFPLLQLPVPDSVSSGSATREHTTPAAPQTDRTSWIVLYTHSTSAQRAAVLPVPPQVAELGHPQGAADLPVPPVHKRSGQLPLVQERSCQLPQAQEQSGQGLVL